MSTNETPRTDNATFVTHIRGEQRPVVSAFIANDIEKELTVAKAEVERLNKAIDQLTTDVNYVGGVQYWQGIANLNAIKLLNVIKIRDAWKKMAGDIMDQLDSWSNLHPNHVTSGDVEVKAAYEKLLKEDEG